MSWPERTRSFNTSRTSDRRNPGEEEVVEDDGTEPEAGGEELVIGIEGMTGDIVVEGIVEHAGKHEEEGVPEGSDDEGGTDEVAGL